MLEDVSGRQYIDLTSQWATNNLGNVHPEVLKATEEGLARYGFLIYFMNAHVPMIELAEKLLSVRPSKGLRRVFLELSGTGAAEAAVKFAVETQERPLILSFMGQYHGLSIGTNVIGSLSAKERRHWEAYMGGVVHAPYPVVYHRPRGLSPEEYGEEILGFIEERLLRHVADPSRIAAAIFEPVACEAGIWIPPKNFVVGLSRLCRRHGWFFIDDEVETGLGRTGRLWAIEHFGVAPDMVSVGKALGGGLMPISAVLGTERALGRTSVAAGTTFGGHPAACMAAVATIDVMLRDRIVERSAELGRKTLDRARDWERLRHVGDVRGLGLCVGVELVDSKAGREPNPGLARRVFNDCVRHGVIPLYNYGDHVLRIQPPLTIPEAQLDTALDVMGASLRRHEG